LQDPSLQEPSSSYRPPPAPKPFRQACMITDLFLAGASSHRMHRRSGI
jgi:hypothetical protein